MGRRRVKKQPTSQTPVSGAAARQVLGCYELLHHICSFMDIPTLLHAQLVSQHWHDMISISPLLQQNLYLKPRPSVNPDQPHSFNPLLFKHFEPILKGRMSPYRWDGALSENILRMSGMSITNMKDGRKIHKAFTRRGASWRRMLIAQPPITSVGYVSKVFSGRSDMMAGDWSLLSFPNGLRMGDFYDMVFQAIWGKPDDVVGYVYVESGLNGFLDDTVQRMLYKWGKLPAFLIESESIKSASRWKMHVPDMGEETHQGIGSSVRKSGYTDTRIPRFSLPEPIHPRPRTFCTIPYQYVAMDDHKQISAPIRIQTRSSLACLECRLKHVKCDAKQPHCTRCTTFQKQCQYPTSRRGGPHRAAISERKRRLSKKNSDQPRSGTTGALTDATIPELDVELMHYTDIELQDRDISPEGVYNESETHPEQEGLEKDPLVLSYYKNFHAFHPFALPLPQLVRLCEGTSTSSFDFTALTVVMRLIGNLYDAQEWSSSLQNEIESRISQLSSSDPVQVQCRLLYSIALFWSSHTTESREQVDVAINLALEMGMHKREFASACGAGDVVLIESWRRTWWMLYIVDAYYAGTLGTMNFKTFHVEVTVPLPCEEDEYESGRIPEPRMLQDFETREFADNDISFSSFTYLIGAVRAAALAISVTPKRVKRQDSERVIQAADSVIDAWLLLLPKERKVMRNDGSIDELMFQAYLLIHVCAREAPTDTARPDLINVHTTRILKSIDAQIQLLALPVRPFHHTPFATCMVSEGTLSLLSACKYLLRDKELAIARDQIRLTIGCLKSLGEVWTRTARNVQEIQTIARHVLALEKTSTVPGSSELPSLTGSDGRASSQTTDVMAQDDDAVASLGSLADICGWINMGSEFNYDWMDEEFS
ncbi:hypothetical protein FSPOR_5857 [Fusarium sporotrichioides]|uniref:Zn(2)-C6 fungal-type domain-containing protein n=1 Tax=Fusarium sporotrichioides TaxID=5514 RepID=A0A395S5L9_FUSSP|nr:hypothetical protein FSPOR_5857 [Fusarium sporotrichioides]